jgi:hypothetical protein
MRKKLTLITFVMLLIALLAFAGVANADPPSPQDADPHSQNVHEMGHDLRAATFSVPDGQRKISSDIAFQGKYAYQGTYDGFRVVDISAPGNPKLIAEAECNGDQGDIVVWDNILVRSWNTKRSEDRACGGTTVPAGFEGVHVWDISDPANPTLLGALELPCGSHTATAAGVDDGDLIIYSNNSSSSGCGIGLDRAGQDALGDFMDVIAVPLDDPASISLIHREPLAGPADPAVRTGCHDAGVVLGDINKAACASADTLNVWDISDAGIQLPSPWMAMCSSVVGSQAAGARPNAKLLIQTLTRACSSMMATPARSSANGSCHVPRVVTKTAPSTTTTSCPCAAGATLP